MQKKNKFKKRAQKVARFNIEEKKGKDRDVCDCCGYGIAN